MLAHKSEKYALGPKRALLAITFRITSMEIKILIAISIFSKVVKT